MVSVHMMLMAFVPSQSSVVGFKQITQEMNKEAVGMLQAGKLPVRQLQKLPSGQGSHRAMLELLNLLFLLLLLLWCYWHFWCYWYFSNSWL